MSERLVGTYARFVGLWVNPPTEEFLLRLRFEDDGQLQDYRFEDTAALDMFSRGAQALQRMGFRFAVIEQPNIESSGAGQLSQPFGIAGPTLFEFERTPLYRLGKIRAGECRGGRLDGTGMLSLTLDPEEEDYLRSAQLILPADNAATALFCLLNQLSSLGYELDTLDDPPVDNGPDYDWSVEQN